ncbi:5-oxoprolinase subunit B family protein [Streptomyces hainanensis]|uniref:5-oxoprolinase subunit B family protein n=1 Tax=Streptomyces hainanensis TaxID=402648 RepID=UPI001FB7B447|nr:allophanate hydrolase subunit 1 [Streptomyces hainanensis]
MTGSRDGRLLGVRRVGDRAVLAELDGLPSVLALRASLLADRPAGVAELVPAAATLLVRYDPAVTGRAAVAGALAERVAGLTAEDVDQPPSPHDTLTVPVRYTGPDLPEVAEATGLDVAEIVARHTAPLYTVAFAGFAPGFGYLTGTDPVLHLPRRAEPRTAVPAGSVAVAGGFTGVYPRSSPGGWRLLGTTDVPLWDPDRDPPALLVPGRTVRFAALPGGAA